MHSILSSVGIMNEILDFLNKFGSLINTALLATILAIIIQVFRVLVTQKDAQIEVLKERSRMQETFSVENVVERFDALKRYYEVQLKEWYEASLQSLEISKENAIAQKETEFQKRIEAEIQKRKEVVRNLTERSAEFDPEPLKPSDVVGSYSITGHNPHTPDLTYFGVLTIRQNGSPERNLLTAHWRIGPKEKQQHVFGRGMQLGSIAAFHFLFGDEGARGSTGIIVYESISKGVLRGYWTSVVEPTGRIGFEECRQLDQQSLPVPPIEKLSDRPEPIKKGIAKRSLKSSYKSSKK
jgi:hypothetical protein